MSKKPVRMCTECKRTTKITGRGRCSGCYKRMMNQNKPNDYVSKFPTNSGMFSKKSIPWNKSKTGIYSSEVIKKLRDLNSGENNPQYKHGKHITYHRKARRLIEEALGRKLEKNETVHHLDGDKTNNSISNLKIFDHHSLHMEFHWEIQKKKRIKGRLKTLKGGV